jgi:transcriptional regulator with XRE-family HTH domain
MLRSRGMAEPRRGRPPNPVDPEASHAARLGAEIRTRRTTDGLTLQQLVDLAGYTPQYLSEVERAKATPTVAFVAAVDRALDARGALERLLPPVLQDRELQRQERAEARRAEPRSSLRCDPATHSEVAGDDEDVEPTTRRGLIGAGAVAALGSATAAMPAAAREVDPALPAHWRGLLRLLGRHDEVSGPHDVLATVRGELGIIAEHRKLARGELRTQIMRVEARWADLAAWLSEDTGDSRARKAWTDHALRLATEAGYPDMVAFARSRQSKLASDPRRAVAYAEDALSVPGASAQTRAWCARYAAIGHALAGDAASCERHLAVAYRLLEDDDSPAPPWAGGFRVTHTGALAAEARCWLTIAPAKAIGLCEDALRAWPQAEARDGGIVQARLALACANAGELDRARAEGAKALSIAKQTGSATAIRDLRRLKTALVTA